MHHYTHYKTYEDIVNGYGWLTIVGITETTDPNWRNKPNIRTFQSINISTDFTENGQTSAIPNTSPIIFQNTTKVMGSGSGLFVEEELVQDASNLEIFNSIHN